MPHKQRSGDLSLFNLDGKMLCKQRSDVSRLFNSDVCAFCGIKEDNEMLYGKYIVSDEISVHSNCMFFASGLSQHGKDENDGFSGFLLPDIEQEILRGKRLMCCYCRKKGATIGCVEARCKKSFHLPCGIEHNSLHHFFGTFESFCKDHSPKQKAVEVTDDIYCQICYEKIAPENLSSCLYSPCCKNNWFHKICLQKYALSAGLHFFKCPLCKNSEDFIQEMEIHGICIPDKDASWELEANAYEELLIRPECNAPVCNCAKGRKYSSQKNSGWMLLPCSHCGYSGMHKTCGKIKLSTDTWLCQECMILDNEITMSKNSCASVLDTNKVQASNMTASAIEGDQVNKNSTFESTSSSSSFSSTFYIGDNNKGNQTGILYVTSSDINCKMQASNHVKDIVQTCNIECAIRNDADDLQQFDHSNSSVENEVTYSNIKRPKTCLQDKKVNNLKDIKNISPNALNAILKSRVLPKPRSLKKPKRKVEHVCSAQKNCCIRKYFNPESGKYRV